MGEFGQKRVREELAWEYSVRNLLAAYEKAFSLFGPFEAKTIELRSVLRIMNWHRRFVFMKPLVSILIPAYNAENWLGYTLQSAVAQTWERKEIIVVDDGSTDGTADLARQFASKGVQVVSTENHGLCGAVNHAYSLCHGDYIQELDSDDILSPDKIERQLAALNDGDSKRILLSSPWGYFYFRTRRARFIPNSLWHDLSPVEWLLRKMGENLHMQNATWLVSRELAEAAGPWDTRLHYDQDGEYFAR